MADESAAAVSEPTSAAPLTGPIRPEARAALDSLSERLYGGDKPETASATSEEKTAAESVVEPPAKPAAATAPEPVKPKSDMPTLDDLITPPEPGGTKPPEEAKTGFPPVDEIFPEKPAFEIRSEKGRENYGKQRETYRAMEHRVKELETQLKSARPDETAAARIADLEARCAEMSKGFERVSLMEHPAFVAQFEKPIAALLDSASQLVRDAALDTKDFGRVMSLSGSDRLKALDQFAEAIESPTMRRRLERIVEEIESKETERGKVLSDVRGNLDRLQREEKVRTHQQMEAQKKELNGLVDALHDHFAVTSKIPFFQKGDGPQYEKWNADLESDKEQIRDLVTNCKDPSQLAGAIALGVKLPRVYAWGLQQKKRAEAAEAQLAERNAVRPDLGGASQSVNGNGTEPEDNGDMSVEGIRNRLRSLRR